MYLNINAKYGKQTIMVNSHDGFDAIKQLDNPEMKQNCGKQVTDLNNKTVPQHALRLPSLDGRNLAAGLYIVSTPIGNLKDITLRALEALSGAQIIYCEDTRVSGKLMAAYGLKAPLVSYHEHNGAQRRPEILAKLEQGAVLALISDAGTPLISDPGFKLVQDVIAGGHKVFPIPGASALLAGVVASGLPTDSILFAGFAPNKAKARDSFFAAFKDVDATLVFYESPNRIHASLKAMEAVFGANRQACVGRELTKRFETFHHGSLAELVALGDGIMAKGEFVVCLAPAPEAAVSESHMEDMLRTSLKTLPLSRAAADVAQKLGLPKRDVYQKALTLQGLEDD